ncbi:class I SAM-dependent methyltransferase [Streptomyces sp. NPDC057445]|uniref:class I SAM-dependent methyltransferase n=1 Tax=Streptomyces sp. NPDC057445 TaxID=3346136 RepID=UPI0036B911EE
MPVMPTLERVFCRSAPWGVFAGRVVLPWALAGAALEGRVLEIGSGGGTMAAQLLTTHPGITLTAVDPDPAMVVASARRLASFGDRVSVRKGDATGLPFADGTFDAVVSFLMLHHVVAWEKALAEAARVLRPDGLLIGYDLLDTGPARSFHRAEGAQVRLATVDGLRRVVGALPFRTPEVRRRLGGYAVTFSAYRAGP